MGNHVGTHVQESVVEGVVVSVSSKATWGGAVTGIVGYLAQVNWIGWASVLIAFIGLGFNVYFNHRRDKREAAESAARTARETAESAARIAALHDRCEL